MALRLPLAVRITTVLQHPRSWPWSSASGGVSGTSPDGDQVLRGGPGCAVVRPQPDGSWRIAADAWQRGDPSFPLTLPRFPRRRLVILSGVRDKAGHPTTNGLRQRRRDGRPALA